jgi:hypothetical protein
MLKAQLKSKIFQLGPKWRENEDILTGDFFGILDYLPRNPYLNKFISYVASLNPNVQTLSTDGVDWDNTKIRFWPRTSTDEEDAEPDIVIVSNKWILVIEVKLQSAFGDTQPWREYVVGRKIAEEHLIPKDSVYYLVLARKRLNIAPTFNADEAEQLNELAPKTCYLKWHEVVSLVESWLRGASTEHELLAEHERMLTDLFNAMRRRRAIAFSGFAFANLSFTSAIPESIFCPPRFTGFQYQSPETQPTEETVFLSSCHAGFLIRCPEVGFLKWPVFLDNQFDRFLASCQEVKVFERPLFLGSQFDGFTRNSQVMTRTYDSVFFDLRFTGFLKNVPTCGKYEHFFKKG